MGTFDDNRRTVAAAHRGPGPSSSARSANGDIGLERKIDRFPFVPDDEDRLALDCYEAYNIQVSGLEQRLRAIGQPKIVIGVSGGSTRRMPSSSRPRRWIGCGGRAPTSSPSRCRDSRRRRTRRTTRSCSWRRWASRGRSSTSARPRRRCCGRWDTLRAWRGGLRRDLRERAGGHAHRLPLPHREPAWQHRPRHRRPVRAGPRMVHLRGGGPDVALRGQRRGPQDPHAAPHPLGRVLGSVRGARGGDADVDPRHGDHAGADPGQGGEQPQSTQAIIGPYSLQDFNLYLLRWGSAPRRSRSCRGMPGTTPRPATGPPTRLPSAWPTTSRPSGAGWRCSCGASSPTSSNGRPCPTGPRSRLVVRSPRGDWRMPSDVSAATWLDELDANVPEA